MHMEMFLVMVVIIIKYMQYVFRITMTLDYTTLVVILVQARQEIFINAGWLDWICLMTTHVLQGILAVLHK